MHYRYIGMISVHWVRTVPVTVVYVGVHPTSWSIPVCSVRDTVLPYYCTLRAEWCCAKGYHRIGPWACGHPATGGFSTRNLGTVSGISQETFDSIRTLTDHLRSVLQFIFSAYNLHYSPYARVDADNKQIQTFTCHMHILFQYLLPVLVPAILFSERLLLRLLLSPNSPAVLGRSPLHC